MVDCLCEAGRRELHAKYIKLRAHRSKISSAVQGDFRSVQEYLTIMQNQQKMKNELRELRMTRELLTLCGGNGSSKYSSINFETSKDGFLPEHLLVGFGENNLVTTGNSRQCASNFRNNSGDSSDLVPFRGLSDVSIGEPERRKSESVTNKPTGEWVMVYGFQENLLPLIESMFCEFGYINGYEESHCGTWIAIRYEQACDAKRALAQHLTVVQGSVIGVTDKLDVITRALAANRKVPTSGRMVSPIRRLTAMRAKSFSKRCHVPKRVTGWRKLLENLLTF